MCGDRASGGAQGYRPLGFATSQQPLHLDSSQHFSWGPPHLSHDGYSSFTVLLFLVSSFHVNLDLLFVFYLIMLT